MNKGQKRFVITCSVGALVGSCLWLYVEPRFEPAIVFFGNLGGLATSYWPKLKPIYARQRPAGRVTFDYSKNDGLYAIGSGDLFFETKWTKANDTSIHTYNDRPSIQGIALALDAQSIPDVTDASSYEMSSRTVTSQEGEIVVLKNSHGNFAVVHVTDVKDRNRSDNQDEVTFEYSINPAGRADFSKRLRG